MSTERKGLEIYVGAFLFIGLACIAIMAVVFGRVGQGLKDFYNVTVEFPNASGIISDSDVLLAGALIGKVDGAPKLVGESFTVRVNLKIRSDVKIPRKSTFLVGSSGLLGDRFVDVAPQSGFDANDIIKPDELIVGSRAGGLDDLTQKGGVVMDQLVRELDTIQKITLQLNDKLLSDENMKNLAATFESLKTTGANLQESSKKLDPIFVKADAAVESAKATMANAEAATADLKKTVNQLDDMANSATKTIDSAKSLFDKANRGQGALGLLLSDRETAENLRALIANMRRSGPVFYKDRAVPTPAPAGPRR